MDATMPGTRKRGPRAGNSTVHGAKASQKTLHNTGQLGGKGATTHASVHGAMNNSNKGAAAITSIFPDVNGSSLEPMFVQTMPRLGLHSTSHSNSHQRLDHKGQVDNLHLASAMVTHAVNRAQTATWMQDTELRRYEWQMEQLQKASSFAATDVSAASDARSEVPQSLDQAGLEKLTRNVASLSLQLSRFEMQMKDRMHPMSADLMDSAALAKGIGKLPEPPALPGAGLQAGLTAAGPWPCSALFGVTTNRVSEDGMVKKVETNQPES